MKNVAIRDGNRCVLPRITDPLEVAHLIPLACVSSSNDVGRDQPAFLSLLHMFAGSETTDKITDYLGIKNSTLAMTGASQRKINRLENLITFNKNIHRHWDTRKIILEPVGDPLVLFDASQDAFLTEYEGTFSFP